MKVIANPKVLETWDEMVEKGKLRKLNPDEINDLIDKMEKCLGIRNTTH